MKKLAIAALTLVAITSCSKEATETINSNDPVAVTLSQGAITRTNGNSWVADDRIGVSMYDTGTSDICNSQQNYQYKADQTNSKTDFTAVGSDMFYPVDGTMVDIFTPTIHTQLLLHRACILLMCHRVLRRILMF